MKDRLKQIDLEAIQNQKKINKNLLKNIKRVKMEIQKIDLKIELGTENASLTSIIVPAISTIIAIYLRKKIEDFANQKFIINPIYTNQNLIKIDISGIFEIKLIHIINMIYVLTPICPSSVRVWLNIWAFFSGVILNIYFAVRYHCSLEFFS